MISFISLSARANDALPAFCEKLDKSLRHFKKSEATCNLPENARLPYRTTTYEGHTATVMTEQDAQKLFKELKAHSEIPYEFSFGGCEYRAHAMVQILRAKGITPLKAFAVVDLKTVNVLTAPHPKKKNETIQWKYHTSPLILVEKNGKIEPYTLDPSLESQAVPIPKWKSDMIRHNPKTVAEIRIRPATQLLPEASIPLSFDDKAFDKDVADTLKRYKQWAADPDGEELYRDEIEYNERQAERMNSF
ncbi:hypothetical protein D3C87_1088930 [compost metagenome]